MENMAVSHQLFFEEISNNEAPGSVTANIFDNAKWFALASTQDNPFVWINIGYWQEKACQLVKSDPETKSLLIISEKPVRAAGSLNSNELTGKYIQSFAAISCKT
jgi:hypothetical protein